MHVFLAKNSICECTTHKNKFKWLLCSKKLVLDTGFKDF